MTEVTTGIGWNLNDWGRAYRNGADARGLLLSTRNAIAADELDANGLPRRGSAWIALASEEQLTKQISYLESLKASAEEEGTVLPLYGVPFAVKDNIDAADFHTTAACPEYAYEPDDDAFVVQLLRKAGAIVMGKTNLDQFATGLVGTRSPYGAVNNAFNPDYISGGSSSGSATAVAKGQVACDC